MAAPDAYPLPTAMSPPTLLIISDSLFLDQAEAHREAFRMMAADMAKRLGNPPEQAAAALERRSPARSGKGRTAKALAEEICGDYLAERRRLTHVPEGLVEGLEAAKQRAGEKNLDLAVVGISPLPAASLAGYLNQTRLRSVMERVYGMADGTPPGWIRGIGGAVREWPSAALLQGIAALHHRDNRQCLLFSADEIREGPPARQLGMRCIGAQKPQAGRESLRFDHLADRIYPVRLKDPNERERP